VFVLHPLPVSRCMLGLCSVTVTFETFMICDILRYEMFTTGATVGMRCTISFVYVFWDT
jgi:hypothetical protein